MVDNSTDKIFQKAFENAPIPGPSEVRWRAISEQAGLADTSTGSTVSSIINKKIFIALLVVGVGAAAYLFSSNEESALTNAASITPMQTAELSQIPKPINASASQVYLPNNAQKEDLMFNEQQQNQVTFQSVLSYEPNKVLPGFEAANNLVSDVHIEKKNGVNEDSEKSHAPMQMQSVSTNQFAGVAGNKTQSSRLSGEGKSKQKVASVKSNHYNNSLTSTGPSGGKTFSNAGRALKAPIVEQSKTISANSANRSKYSLFDIDFAPEFIKSDALAKLIAIDRMENGPWLTPAAPRSKTSVNVEMKSGARNGEVQLLPYLSFDHELNTYTIADRYASGVLSIQEDRALAYSIGLRTRYLFKHRFTADLGMYYVNRGSLIGTLQGSDESLKTDIQVESEYLELPISIGYRFPFEGYGLSFNTGAHLRKNLGSVNSVLMEQDFAAGNTSSIRTSASSIGVSLLASIAVDFRISQNTSFFIEPAYRYALNTMILIDEGADYTLPFNAHLSSFSLGTGLIFSLK